MRIWPQISGEDWKGWAQRLVAALGQFEQQLPGPAVLPGTVVFWGGPVGTIPAGWVRANGGSYLASAFPALARALNASLTGSFNVPNVTAPAGTISIIKT